MTQTGSMGLISAALLCIRAAPQAETALIMGDLCAFHKAAVAPPMPQQAQVYSMPPSPTDILLLLYKMREGA
jgi:hypothetical protein